MATTYNNAQIGVVDASGNLNVIYPITKATNVAYKSTNVDAKLTSLQSAVDTLNSKFSVYSYNNTVTQNRAVAQNNICSFSSYTGTILVFGIYYASYSNSSAGGGTAFIGYNNTQIIVSPTGSATSNIGSDTEPSYFAFNITFDGTLHIYAAGSCAGTSSATVKYNILIIRT